MAKAAEAKPAVVDIVDQDEVRQSRSERFEELGFGRVDAYVLSGVRRNDGVFLYWGDVEKYLDQGATHAQVIRIFE